MNPTPPPKTRLQLVREQAGQGQLRDDTIQRTRLVVSIERLAEDPNNERKTVNNIEELVASVKAHGIIEPITVVALDWPLPDRHWTPPLPRGQARRPATGGDSGPAG